MPQTCWLILYIAFGCAAVPIVRRYGPLSIGNYALESQYDSDNGRANVMYRMLSPVVVCSAFILLASALATVFGLPLAADSWVSVLAYWLAMLVVKLCNRTMTQPVLAFVAEAVASCTVAALFGAYVVGPLAQGETDVLNSSGIALEVEVAFFGVLAQAISAAIVRRQYHIDISSASEPSLGYCVGYFGAYVSESKLFGYERKYAKLLPPRYRQDTLLRSIFFTVMSIEDYNRPAAYRILERVACKFGMAKTTGIMQQRSDEPLSDEESVTLAAGYVGRMWDAFLRAFARSGKGGYGPSAIRFGRDWYEYDYEEVKEALLESGADLYGDYCGSRVLDVRPVLERVIAFEEGYSYGLLPSTVLAVGEICARETNWLGDGEFYWANGHEVAAADASKIEENKRHLISLEHAAGAEVGDMCDAIRAGGGVVLSVKHVDGVLAEVAFSGDVLPPLGKWRLVGSGSSR